MEPINDLSTVTIEGGVLLTIGVFDGVHRGHIYLMDRLKERAQARGVASGVITFCNHPRTVLSPGVNHTYLVPVEERVQRLKAAGIDHVIPLTFTRELSQLTYRQFIDLLVNRLSMKGLLVGRDFAVGKARQGTAEVVRELGKQLGYTLEVVDPLVLDGEVISTTAIRMCLGTGNLQRAQALLGRPHSLAGEVVVGDRRGRTLGFPTANIAVPPEMTLPLDGIYSTVAWLGDRRLDSVTSIGIRPTFGGTRRTVETFIMDFSEDIYGRELRIDLLQRIRDEKRFSNVDDLIVQMHIDVQAARQILAKRGRG